MPVSWQEEAEPLPSGIAESAGRHVEPASLYLEQLHLEQLRERMGPEEGRCPWGTTEMLFQEWQHRSMPSVTGMEKD